MTFFKALKRVQEGEIFEDPNILNLRSGRGWTIAHSQAYRGWTTLDPNILSLRDDGRTTVLDILLRYGNWEPQTEEERLIVFAVKAGA